jgi:nicotinic acid mononucleotide adenylyltransferase
MEENTWAARSTNAVNREAEEAIHDIRYSAGLELFSTEQWAADLTFRDRLSSIGARLDQLLTTISELARLDQIRPFRQIALAEGDKPTPIEDRTVRIGFYPLAANPLHWGHILVGLTAIASISLDKVVFVIAGADSRKPSMLSADARHRLGRSVIEKFHPLFAYSPLALGKDLDGETNFGRLLSLNPGQRMEAFYVAGADHCRRTTAQGQPDTIRKLERVVEEERRAGRTLHTVSAVFVDRAGEEGRQKEVTTSLKMHFLPPIPFSFSSTATRQALRKEASSEALMSLPYSCLLEIQEGALYAGNDEPSALLESPA